MRFRRTKSARSRHSAGGISDGIEQFSIASSGTSSDLSAFSSTPSQLKFASRRPKNRFSLFKSIKTKDNNEGINVAEIHVAPQASPPAVPASQIREEIPQSVNAVSNINQEPTSVLPVGQNLSSGNSESKTVKGLRTENDQRIECSSRSTLSKVSEANSNSKQKLTDDKIEKDGDKLMCPKVVEKNYKKQPGQNAASRHRIATSKSSNSVTAKGKPNPSIKRNSTKISRDPTERKRPASSRNQIISSRKQRVSSDQVGGASIAQPPNSLPGARSKNGGKGIDRKSSTGNNLATSKHAGAKEGQLTRVIKRPKAGIAAASKAKNEPRKTPAQNESKHQPGKANLTQKKNGAVKKSSKPESSLKQTGCNSIAGDATKKTAKNSSGGGHGGSVRMKPKPAARKSVPQEKNMEGSESKKCPAQPMKSQSNKPTTGKRTIGSHSKSQLTQHSKISTQSSNDYYEDLADELISGATLGQAESVGKQTKGRSVASATKKGSRGKRKTSNVPKEASRQGSAEIDGFFNRQGLFGSEALIPASSLVSSVGTMNENNDIDNVLMLPSPMEITNSSDNGRSNFIEGDSFFASPGCNFMWWINDARDGGELDEKKAENRVICDVSASSVLADNQNGDFEVASKTSRSCRHSGTRLMKKHDDVTSEECNMVQTRSLSNNSNTSRKCLTDTKVNAKHEHSVVSAPFLSLNSSPSRKCQSDMRVNDAGGTNHTPEQGQNGILDDAAAQLTPSPSQSIKLQPVFVANVGSGISRGDGSQGNPLQAIKNAKHNIDCVVLSPSQTDGGEQVQDKGSGFSGCRFLCCADEDRHEDDNNDFAQNENNPLTQGTEGEERVSNLGFKFGMMRESSNRGIGDVDEEQIRKDHSTCGDEDNETDEDYCNDSQGDTLDGDDTYDATEYDSYGETLEEDDTYNYSDNDTHNTSCDEAMYEYDDGTNNDRSVFTEYSTSYQESCDDMSYAESYSDNSTSNESDVSDVVEAHSTSLVEGDYSEQEPKIDILNSCAKSVTTEFESKIKDEELIKAISKPANKASFNAHQEEEAKMAKEEPIDNTRKTLTPQGGPKRATLRSYLRRGKSMGHDDKGDAKSIRSAKSAKTTATGRSLSTIRDPFDFETVKSVLSEKSGNKEKLAVDADTEIAKEQTNVSKPAECNVFSSSIVSMTLDEATSAEVECPPTCSDAVEESKNTNKESRQDTSVEREQSESQRSESLDAIAQEESVVSQHFQTPSEETRISTHAEVTDEVDKSSAQGLYRPFNQNSLAALGSLAEGSVMLATPSSASAKRLTKMGRAMGTLVHRKSPSIGRKSPRNLLIVENE